MSLETAQKVIVPQKKIMSRIFLNSGTLIVICTRFNLFCNTLKPLFLPTVFNSILFLYFLPTVCSITYLCTVCTVYRVCSLSKSKARVQISDPPVFQAL